MDVTHDLPDDLDIEKALIYFHAYMYGPLRGKVRLYEARGVSPRVAMSEDWELFASILVRDRGVPGQSGLDLERYEVKSASAGSAFEYQYHRNTAPPRISPQPACCAPPGSPSAEPSVRRAESSG